MPSVPKRSVRARTKKNRELKARLRGLVMQGFTEEECMEEMGLPLERIRWLKNQLLADELVDVTNDSPSETFVKYALRQEGCIADLDEIITSAKTGKFPLNNAIGAVKAKSQIIDRVLERGQDLGVIHREAQKSESKVAVAIAEARVDELRAMVADKKKSFEDRKASYALGAGGPVLDVEAIYLDDKTSPTESTREGPKPPARAKVVEG